MSASSHNTGGDPFGEFDVVDVYTRAEAIADGVLIAAPDGLSREAGLGVPVALTRAAWEDCVAWSGDDDDRKGRVTGQDQLGRLWDVLFMTRIAMGRAPAGQSVRVDLLRVPRIGRGLEPSRARLVATIGPGDVAEPVITVGLPGED